MTLCLFHAGMSSTSVSLETETGVFFIGVIGTQEAQCVAWVPGKCAHLACVGVTPLHSELASPLLLEG